VVLLLLAYWQAYGVQMLRVIRFTKAPVPPCRTVLLSFETRGLSVFDGPVPGSILDELRQLGVDLQQQIAEALRKSGFEPKTDSASCHPCDLAINFRVIHGEVRLRSTKGAIHVDYFAPAKLSLDFEYSSETSPSLGTVRGKLESPGKTDISELAYQIAVFTATKIPRKE
jgi:hypothetical protein